MEEYEEAESKEVQTEIPTSDGGAQTEEEVTLLSSMISRGKLISVPSNRGRERRVTADDSASAEGLNGSRATASSCPASLVPAIGRRGWVIDDPLAWQPSHDPALPARQRNGRQVSSP